MPGERINSRLVCFEASSHWKPLALDTSIVVVGKWSGCWLGGRERLGTFNTPYNYERVLCTALLGNEDKYERREERRARTLL